MFTIVGFLLLTLLGYATPENHPPIGRLRPPGESIRAGKKLKALFSQKNLRKTGKEKDRIN